MAEYIEREALLRDISESVVVTVRHGKPSPELRGVSKVIDRIKSVPTADVAEVWRGEWVFVDDVNDEDARYYCSLCQAGDVHKKEFNVPYCWMCGARMDGKGETDA